MGRTMQMLETVEKIFSMTDLRRHIRTVWNYIDTPGQVAVITKYGKHAFVMMSVETYARLSPDYEKTMRDIQDAASRCRTEMKANEHGYNL